jgi:hypothetical protein
MNGFFLNSYCSQQNHLIHKGVVKWNEGEDANEGHVVLDRCSHTHANLGVPFKLVQLRLYFNYKWHYTDRAI